MQKKREKFKIKKAILHVQDLYLLILAAYLLGRHLATKGYLGW